MKIKLFAALLALTLFPVLAQAQIGDITNPLNGRITVVDAGTCATANSFVMQQLPQNASTTTVNLSGTFTATLTARLSNNGGATWTTGGAVAAGTTSFSTNGFTQICVDSTAFTSGTVVVTISTGLLQVQSVVSSSSPSSLTTFFNRYYGLAPQDYGAKGDTHIFNDCSESAGVATITCTGSHFASTDVGKQYEIVCAGGVGNTATGTITAFNSATSIGVSLSCSTLSTNVQVAYGTDDTAALQSWVTAMIAAAVKGTPAISRGGYIPQGGYWNTKPLKFIFPGLSPNDTSGECGPNATQASTIPCGIWIAGQGSTASYFYVPSNFNWGFPDTASNTGAVYFKNWSFPNVSNFAVISGSQILFNTTANSGAVGGIVFDGNSHAYVQSLWVQGFHNTASPARMPGVAIVADFESSYYNIASESNDTNWAWNPLNAAVTFEKIMLDTIYLENPNDSGNVGNMDFGSSTSLKQVRLRNLHFLGSHIVDINLRAATNDPLEISEMRSTSVTGGAVGIYIQTGAGNAIVDCTGCDLENTSGVAATFVSRLDGAGAKLNFFGGRILCTACTNFFNNAGTIFAYGTSTSGPAVSAVQTGSGQTFGFFPTTGATGGWNGSGTMQSTQYVSNQGAVCTVGELALSAGWQSTGLATVTAVSGTGQTCKWTITTGTTTAANPTVTDTLTNALPAATTVCELNIHGGTHTALTGEGFDQTALSATAPIFTANFTPTAGGTTYLVTRRCGP